MAEEGEGCTCCSCDKCRHAMAVALPRDKDLL